LPFVRLLAISTASFLSERTALALFEHSFFTDHPL